METTRNFSVYRSSAGSGKTFTLVYGYIRLAIKSPRYFRHILAITFTNKAANEMKQRIILALMHLSDTRKYAETSTVTTMLPMLVNDTGLPVNEISQNASKALTQILHLYDDFSVRTIDSFVSGIIRVFAHDLRLPVDFEVELQGDVLLNLAIDNVMAKIGVDKALTQLLLEYTESQMDEGKSWNIEKNIYAVAKQIFFEDSIPYLQQLREVDTERFLQIARQIKTDRYRIAEMLSGYAKEALQLLHANAIPAQALAGGSKGIFSYFSKISRKEIVKPTDTVNRNVRDDQWEGSKASTAQKQSIEQIKGQLSDFYYRIISDTSGVGRYTFLKLIDENLSQMGVLTELEKEVEAVAREQSVIHISEFNKRITDIIIKEPAPFIYERLGEKYHHYLVDEFQDTSELQWKNLLPLLGNSLANGYYNLVVGDGKQAIYRFRNGKVEQFMLLPHLPENFEPSVFAETQAAMQHNFQQHNLARNYRSKQEIIQFNNGLFGQASEFLGERFSPIYQAHEQQSKPDNSGGLVKVELLSAEVTSGMSDEHLQRIHTTVQRLLEQGYAYSDMAILVRRRSEGSAIANHLIKNKIPVISGEALLLSGSNEVNFLVSLLTFIHDRHNQIAIAHIVSMLSQKGILKQGLIDVFSEKQGIDLPKCLIENGINLDINILQTYSLYDLCEELIRIFSVANGKYNPYVVAFLDFVKETSGSKGVDLPNLLEVWEQQKFTCALNVPSQMNAVQIMTVHKSKGLEFKVVIWPIAKASSPRANNSWVQLQQHEAAGLPVALVTLKSELGSTAFSELYANEKAEQKLDLINMMYVACTRAVERLYVFAAKGGRASDNDPEKILEAYVATQTENWDNDNQVYQLGEEQQSNKPIDNIIVEKDTTSMVSVAWHNRIRLARRSPAEWDKNNEVTKKDWGNMVHEAIAGISTLENWQQIAAETALQYNLGEDDKRLLFNKVERVIAHTKLNSYFKADSKVLAERSILTPAGNVYRPDRVIANENQTTVLEFKTGQPLATHADQVETYADMLQQMGYPNVKKLLVYIDEDVEVIEL